MNRKKAVAPPTQKTRDIFPYYPAYRDSTPVDRGTVQLKFPLNTGSINGVIKETRIIDGPTYVTQYTYDMNGNIRTMTYPSGRVITYAYPDNKVISVLNKTANLATGITYKPFGGMASLIYGNGIMGTIGYDNQYRIASITAGTVMNLSYTDDANGNITAITNNQNATKNKNFTYDALDRLATATSTGIWGSLAWTYDGTGNRKTENTNSYTYQANSNKLSSANGITFGYDTNGNTATENTRQYTYNQNQRLIQVADGTMMAGYTYNGNGQRVKKQVNGQTTIFHYNQSGQIIAESNSAGVTTAEYVYLNGQPLAKIEGTDTYFYHNDHLGTPQKLTDSTGAVAWSADYKPFGEALITGTVTNNLRFPGQYYDAETGLYYNYFRDYNPNIGRYVQADPIGLRGGINLFAYTKNNPIKFTDSTGLTSGGTKCPCGTHWGIDWVCVDETWLLLNGGRWGVGAEAGVGVGGTIWGVSRVAGSVLAGGVSAVLSVWGGSTYLGAMMGCQKCIQDK